MNNSTASVQADKFLLGVSKILDRLIKGPGAKRGELHYTENVEAEYNFLRKKAKEISSEYAEVHRLAAKSPLQNQ